MKRNVLLFLILATFSAITLSSFKKGVAWAVDHHAPGTTSGSPKALTGIQIGSTKTIKPFDCSGSGPDGAAGFTVGCHTAATPFVDTLDVKTEVYDDYPTNSMLNTNNGFIPGQNYGIKISGTSGITGATAHDTAFGFQCVLFGWRAGSTSPLTPGAAAFGTIPISVSDTNYNSIIVEQTITAMHNVGTDKHKFQVIFRWTAPSAAADIDTVQIRTLLCAVDSDGTASGDICTAAPTVLTMHNSVKGAVKEMFKNAGFTVYPNPTANNATLKLTNIGEGEFVLYAYSMNGSRMMSRTINVVGNNHIESINMSAWPAGMYQLQLGRYGVYQNIPVIKQ